MPITNTTLRLDAQARAALAKITDQQTRDLVKAWVAAWDEVAPALRDALTDLATGGATRAEVLRATKLRRSLAVIADHLDKITHDAGVRITSDVGRVVREAGETQASIIASQLPPRQDLVDADAWARVDDRQVTAIVHRTTEQITKLTYPLSGEAYQAVQSQLLRGIATGANPREVARRIVARAEGGFNGGLNRALTIARTELLDAHRAAAHLGQAAHSDVLRGWVWTAEMGPRTCAACLSMHGTEFALTDPGPQGHQNCVLPGTVLSGPRPSASTTRWFDGEVIDVEVLGGAVLSVTPNHPVLTPHGWVPAGLLREGDEVVRGTGPKRPAGGGGPDDHQVPALVEDVAQTLGGPLPVHATSVPTAAEDFHGDGAGSQVHVVRTHGGLLAHGQPAQSQVPGQRRLLLGDTDASGLPGLSSLHPFLPGTGAPSHGLVSSGSVAGVLLRGTSSGHQAVRLSPAPGSGISVLEDPRQVAAGHPEVAGETGRRLPGGVTLDYSMPLREDLTRFAGAVSTALVVGVRRRSYSGHVYNFQTETGWYLADGILTHNCRCTRVPLARSWEDLGFKGVREAPSLHPDAGDYFTKLPKADQVKTLGVKGHAAWERGDWPMSSWATRQENPGWRPSYVVARPPA
jgi:hypothetical protein